MLMIVLHYHRACSVSVRCTGLHTPHFIHLLAQHSLFHTGAYSNHGIKPNFKGVCVNKTNQDRLGVSFPFATSREKLNNHDGETFMWLAVVDGHGRQGANSKLLLRMFAKLILFQVPMSDGVVQVTMWQTK
jgi:hypothetical protein